MKREAINYETLSKITDTISSSKELDDVSKKIVRTLCRSLGIKGCALMLLDHKTKELKVAASSGLSQVYLNKGPVSALKSITASLSEGPVAIYDVDDDPRIQYPEEARAEGIKSIMSIPMILQNKPLGVLRFYTSEPWEFTNQDVIFCHAVAEIAALVIDNLRMQKGLESTIDVLRVMLDTP
ncbi:MAG: GAF domain-containing protein [Deltaproteobacteria bacterium]|nr:GAF domain-containing protein [Deltaproteobacteria bacterium]MBW2053485.1 GAF domain-containing protein [Deltaproteobacteria bacterium]MBW2140862.1 GAF domain-containing protein [Deltaproteobacteria bacterium]MBW2323100.1 GAF domain-containing protein [Deltaproteobacteria bacterium]